MRHLGMFMKLWPLTRTQHAHCHPHSDLPAIRLSSLKKRLRINYSGLFSWDSKVFTLLTSGRREHGHMHKYQGCFRIVWQLRTACIKPALMFKEQVLGRIVLFCTSGWFNESETWICSSLCSMIQHESLPLSLPPGELCEGNADSFLSLWYIVCLPASYLIVQVQNLNLHLTNSTITLCACPNWNEHLGYKPVPLSLLNGETKSMCKVERNICTVGFQFGCSKLWAGSLVAVV